MPLETQVGVGQLVELRLLIARAAASDSLQWWDDDALTNAGQSLAARLFPQAPGIVCQRLAMLAARERHRAAFEQTTGDVFHLFDLGDHIELAVADTLRSEEYAVPVPMQSKEQLREELSGYRVIAPPHIDHRGLRSAFEVDANGPMTALDLAILLASGYLLADRGAPVFPYVRRSRVQVVEP